MKPVNEIAKRYAHAFFETLGEAQEEQHILGELRVIRDAIVADAEVEDFMLSTSVPSEKKKEFFDLATKDTKISEKLKLFLDFLGRRERLNFYTDIVEAFQQIVDEKNEVVRGDVTSASVLSAKQRKGLEETVSRVTGKNVILSYSEDENLIGGLKAHVGSFSFDDTITSHLRRLKEEVKMRSVH